MLSLFKMEATPAEAESFGVLRSGDELERLCKAAPSLFLAGTPTRQLSKPLGRLSSDSDSDDSNATDVERLESGETEKMLPAEGYFSEAKYTSQHLAVVFDSVEERDRCLSLFEVAGLLPEPSPDWP
jgi:hypothetical protein